MSDQVVALSSHKITDEFLSQPERIEDPSIGVLAHSGLLQTGWGPEVVESLLARRIRDAVAGLQGVGRAFGDRGLSPRMLDILRSIAQASNSYVEGYRVPEDSPLTTDNFVSLVRPHAQKLHQLMELYTNSITHLESALPEPLRPNYRQCNDTIRSAFQWDPRQRGMILEPARENISEVLLDPEASGVGEFWLLDGLLGLWQNDDRMSIERSFDRGIHCGVSTDPYLLSLLHRFKAHAAAQSGRFTQAFEGAQASLKLHEDWGTYIELAHYSIPIENQGEAISAVRSACRLFPLSIALVVASDNLAPIWQSVDSNFLRYLDDFRSHASAELKHWEQIYDRARNVQEAGLPFELQNSSIPKGSEIRAMLEQEKGLRLISIPIELEQNHQRLGETLANYVTSQLELRYEELRAAKAEMKIVESRRDIALADAEREIRESEDAIRSASKGSKSGTDQSMTGCASLFGMSMVLFVMFSVMAVLLRDTLFTQFPNLSAILIKLSAVPAVMGVLWHGTVLIRNALIAQSNQQRLANRQREYDAQVMKIREANNDQTLVFERRMVEAEAKYRCAQEAERALRGETFRPKGSDIDEANRPRNRAA